MPVRADLVAVIFALSAVPMDAQDTARPATVPGDGVQIVRVPAGNPGVPFGGQNDALQTPPAVPADANGWVVEIVTRGGIMGGTRRTVLYSTGSLTCSTACGAPARPALRSVSTSVAAAANGVWTSLPLSEFCSDCLVTQLSLWRRDRDDSVRAFTARWDSTNAGAIDPALRQLHDRVMTASAR